MFEKSGDEIMMDEKDFVLGTLNNVPITSLHLGYCEQVFGL